MELKVLGPPTNPRPNQVMFFVCFFVLFTNCAIMFIYTMIFNDLVYAFGSQFQRNSNDVRIIDNCNMNGNNHQLEDNSSSIMKVEKKVRGHVSKIHKDFEYKSDYFFRGGGGASVFIGLTITYISTVYTPLFGVMIASLYWFTPSFSTLSFYSTFLLNC